MLGGKKSTTIHHARSTATGSGICGGKSTYARFFFSYFSKHTTLCGGGGKATGNGRSTCRPAFVSPVSTRPDVTRTRRQNSTGLRRRCTRVCVRASASSLVLNELCAFDSSPGKVSVIVAVRRVPAPEDTARGRNDRGRASCLKKYIFFFISPSSLCRPYTYSVRVRPVHIYVYTKRTYLCIHTPADARRP